jgi:hypothetical protein
MNVDRWIGRLIEKGEILREEEIKELCEKLKEKLLDEPNIVNVRAPVTIVGDIQGYV